MRIAVAGTGKLAAGMFRALLASDHEIVAVVQDARQARGFKGRLARFFGRHFGGKNNLSALAKGQGIPVFWIDRMDEDELAPLRERDIDLLLVGGFAIILKKPLLELPNIGCVNMHSSLLPRHRGPNPFCAAILAGDTESGVTFHIMEPGIDTGAIIAQYRFPIDERDTMIEVYYRACELATETVVDVMDKIAAEGLVGVPQDESQANYEKKPTVEDSWIDWRLPARQIDAMVRAMAPSPMPRFQWRGRTITVARCEFDGTPVDAPPGKVLRHWPLVRVATGEGTLTLRVAFTRRPIPWVWPSPWSKAQVGEMLDKRP